MKVLLDHNIPRQIAPLLTGHQVFAAGQLRWHQFRNGRLIRSGEDAGFDVMITGDKGIYHQQNHSDRRLALILVTRTKRRLLLPVVAQLVQAIDRAEPHSFQILEVPDAPRPDRRGPPAEQI